jgi:hypothetical protein
MARLRVQHRDPRHVAFVNVTIARGIGNFNGDKHWLAVFPSAITYRLQQAAGLVGRGGVPNPEAQMGYVGRGLVQTLGEALALVVAPPGLPTTMRELIEDQIRDRVAEAIRKRTSIDAIAQSIGMYNGIGPMCCGILFATDANGRNGEFLKNRVATRDNGVPNFLPQRWTSLTIVHGTAGLVRTELDVWSV